MSEPATINKLECGCITKMYFLVDKGATQSFMGGGTELCKKHKKENTLRQKARERKEKRFNTFPSEKSKLFYAILKRMSDDEIEIEDGHYDNTIKVLKKYAIKLSKIK